MYKKTGRENFKGDAKKHITSRLGICFVAVAVAPFAGDILFGAHCTYGRVVVYAVVALVLLLFGLLLLLLLLLSSLSFFIFRVTTVYPKYSLTSRNTRPLLLLVSRLFCCLPLVCSFSQDRLLYCRRRMAISSPYS